MADTTIPETTKPEIKTDHIRKAIVVIGGFLVVICLVVLIKGVISPPRSTHLMTDQPPTAAPPAGGSELSSYQEKLEQYRQSQGRTEDRPGGASSAGATASSPEDASFVKQQLRLPMLIKDTSQPGAEPAIPVIPAAPANPAMTQRLAELQKRLAEIHQQQQKLENNGGVR